MTDLKPKCKNPQQDRGQAFESEVRQNILSVFGKHQEGIRGNQLIQIPETKSSFFENLDAKIFKYNDFLNLQLEIDACFYIEKADKMYELYGSQFSLLNNSVVAFEVTCSKDSLDKYARKCTQIAIISQVISNYPEQIFVNLSKNKVKNVYFFLIVEKVNEIHGCLKKCMSEVVCKKIKQAINQLKIPEGTLNMIGKVGLLGTIPNKRRKPTSLAYQHVVQSEELNKQIDISDFSCNL